MDIKSKFHFRYQMRKRERKREKERKRERVNPYIAVVCFSKKKQHLMQKHVYMIFSNFPILGTTLELKLFQIQNFLNFKCLDSYISYILTDMKF